MTAPATARCPACSKPATGKFCTSCGAQVTPAHCSNCGAAAGPGARFCAGCGQRLFGDASQPGAIAPARVSAGVTWNPWHVSALLGVVAVAAVLWAALRGGPSTGGDAANPPPVAAADAGTPPDLSTMTPREQFTRLSDRVETSMEAGDTATVVKFFPMVEGAFANLPPGDRDADARLHLGLLRAQVGNFPSALAEVDTIVATEPNHLFADYLRAIVADLQHDTVAATRARAAFRTHYAAEIAAKRPEYDAHKRLLDDFLKTIPAK